MSYNTFDGASERPIRFHGFHFFCFLWVSCVIHHFTRNALREPYGGLDYSWKPRQMCPRCCGYLCRPAPSIRWRSQRRKKRQRLKTCREKEREKERERERERKRERDSCCAIAKSSNKRTRVHHSEAATYPFSERKLTVLSLSKCVCVSVRVPTSLTKIVVSINLTTRALVFSPPFLQVRPLFLFLPLYHRRDITLMNCCGRNPDGMWPNIMARSLGSAWFVYLPC